MKQSGNFRRTPVFKKAQPSGILGFYWVYCGSFDEQLDAVR